MATAENKHHDYSKMFGQNFVGKDHAFVADKDDPFCGEVPRDARSYSQYRGYYERRMMDAMNNQGVLKMSASCEDQDEKGNLIRIRGQKPEHMGCSVVFACDHIVCQDPVNPEGVYFVPFVPHGSAGYYVCKTCFRLIERFKFNMNHLHLKCPLCMSRTIDTIAERHPDRFHNLAEK